MKYTLMLVLFIPAAKIHDSKLTVPETTVQHIKGLVWNIFSDRLFTALSIYWNILQHLQTLDQPYDMVRGHSITEITDRKYTVVS